MWATAPTLRIIAMMTDRTPILERLRSEPIGALATFAAAAVMTVALAPWHDSLNLLNAGLLFLLLTLIISATYGWRVGMLAALVTNLALNFFFVEPIHTLTVQEPENVVALIVFLVVSVVGGSLLTSARASAAEARRRQAETEILLRLSRTMIGRTNADEALAALCSEVVDAFLAPGAAVLSHRGEGWQVLAHAGGDTAGRPLDTQERVIADQALAERRVRRLGYTGFGQRRVKIVGSSGSRRFEQPSSGTAFAPLVIGDRVLGILRLDGPIGATPFRDHPEHLLDAFASEAALGVQRVELVQAAAHADALRQADEMKTALMTSISHDLKTPLAGIKTSVSSLLDNSVEWSDEDRAAFLETIDSQADRLNRVISDILDLNRIESGVIAPMLRSIDVATLLEEVRMATALATQGRDVTVDAQHASAVVADETLLRQALVNLVENAAKYSTPGSPIHLRSTETPAGTIELTIADDGPGIAPQDLPHVFERFYRAQDQSRRVKGSGLGLAIVKGFIDLSGGSVRAESSPSGTVFIIDLPAAPAEVCA